MTNRRKIIGFKGIADYLGTSVSTVWAWSRTGKIRLYARKEAMAANASASISHGLMNWTMMCQLRLCVLLNQVVNANNNVARH